MNFTEEARAMAVSLGRDYPDVIERIAAALSAAYERGEQSGREKERERCATIADEIHKFYSLAVKAVESVRNAK